MAYRDLKSNPVASVLSKRHRHAFLLVLFLIPFLASALMAAEPSPTARGTNSPSGAASRDVDPDAAPAQVEDDRAREEAADRASRRTLSELMRGPYLQNGTTN